MTSLTPETINKIKAHAIAEYPYECCGIVTGGRNIQRVHLCKNIQDILHSEDPAKHPRGSHTAYAIDRKRAEKIFSEAKNNGEDILAFYHSHIDTEAYFSDMDKAVQIVFGEPEFPDAAHIVVSVISRQIHNIKCFVWDREKKDFAVYNCLQMP